MTRAETAANTDSPFTIIVDSREQKPYAYPNAKVKGLHTGDYSIEGMESLIVIERKSKSDAYASLGANRARFEQEWRRMAEVDHAVVVIESDLKDFLTPPPHTLMSPIAAINTLISWSIKYRVQVFFASDRRHARSMVRRILEKYWKHYNATLSAESEAGKLLTQEDINVDSTSNTVTKRNTVPQRNTAAVI